jgi:tetratricopeptide (TPR) repeat protein
MPDIFIKKIKELCIMSQFNQQNNDIKTLNTILECIDNQQANEALILLREHQFSQDYLFIQRQIEAELLASIGENDRAERLYLMLIREYPEKFEPKFALSQFYQKNGRLAQALTIINQVLETNPDFYMAWNNLGNIYRDLKEYTQAIESFKKSLSLKEDYIIALSNLCLVYLDVNAPQLTIDLAQKTLLTYPSNAFLYSHLAKAYLKLNMIDKAKKAIEDGLSYDPLLNTLLMLNDQI